MNPLLYSPAFHPSVGGLEGVVQMLAEGLATAGHRPIVVTTTPGNGPDAFPFAVVRQPPPLEMLGLARASDLFFQANVSLRGIWPWLLADKPLVISHHGWYCEAEGCTWKGRLKQAVCGRAINISASHAVAARIPAPSVVIPNPYRDDVFRLHTDVERERDLVFVGRLVSDKGCNLLLQALGLLATESVRPSLTVVGGGPEHRALEEQTTGLGLRTQVRFAGVLRGEPLARMVNAHRVMVVPSLWAEPFGIVALEGIACGCVVVGTDGGGLPEAIGPCGVTVPRNDPAALAAAIGSLLQNPEERLCYQQQAPGHLAMHRREAVVGRYLEVLEQAVGKGAVREHCRDGR